MKYRKLKHLSRVQLSRLITDLLAVHAPHGEWLVMMLMRQNTIEITQNVIDWIKLFKPFLFESQQFVSVVLYFFLRSIGLQLALPKSAANQNFINEMIDVCKIILTEKFEKSIFPIGRELFRVLADLTSVEYFANLLATIRSNKRLVDELSKPCKREVLTYRLHPDIERTISFMINYVFSFLFFLFFFFSFSFLFLFFFFFLSFFLSFSSILFYFIV